nr:hypothetical protein CFP56_78328 [Quercus suber]
MNNNRRSPTTHRHLKLHRRGNVSDTTDARSLKLPGSSADYSLAKMDGASAGFAAESAGKTHDARGSDPVLALDSDLKRRNIARKRQTGFDLKVHLA